MKLQGISSDPLIAAIRAHEMAQIIEKMLFQAQESCSIEVRSGIDQIIDPGAPFYRFRANRGRTIIIQIDGGAHDRVIDNILGVHTDSRS